MSTIKKLLLIGFISTGLLTNNAFAKNPNQQTKSHHMGSPMKVFKGLGLTSTQRKQIKAIFKYSRKQLKEINKNIKPLNVSLKEQTRSKVYNEVAVADITNKITTIKRQGLQIMTRAKHRAWSVLTIEQQQKVIEKEAKQKERTKKRKEKKKAKKQRKSKKKEA